MKPSSYASCASHTSCFAIAWRKAQKWLYPVSSGAARRKIQLSKINLAHSSATLQVRSTFSKRAELVMGERCCTGRPKGGTAFRRLRPPIALAIASRQPLTGAPNECRPQGGFPKTPLAQRYAERARGADSRSRSIFTPRGNHMPPWLRGGENHTPLTYSRQNRGCVNQKPDCAPP